MLSVDIAGLDATGRCLRSVADGLDTRGRVLAELLAPDDPVAAALRGIEGDWSRQRRAIVSYLAGVGSAAIDAAALYAEIERRLTRAAR